MTPTPKNRTLRWGAALRITNYESQAGLLVYLSFGSGCRHPEATSQNHISWGMGTLSLGITGSSSPYISLYHEWDWTLRNGIKLSVGLSGFTNWYVKDAVVICLPAWALPSHSADAQAHDKECPHPELVLSNQRKTIQMIDRYLQNLYIRILWWDLREHVVS